MPSGPETHRCRPARPMRPLQWMRFIAGYLRVNLQAALEYRLSFFSQAFAMLLNDGMWLVFWIAFFDRFPLVAGWERRDIVTLWAVVASGFGVATTICGNVFRLAAKIARGEIDAYLTLPKPILPHVLISRMTLTAPGDVLFGLLVFGLMLHPEPVHWLLFALFTLTTAAVFLGFGVLTQSLTFWVGQGEGLAGQLTNTLITLSTYPTAIFHGWVKVALFTVLPAGFITYLPVRLMRQFSWPLCLALVGFSAGILILGWLAFRAGLRRYESGNLFLLQD